MKVYRSLTELGDGLRNTAVTVGNFDGVHLGHREMFRRVKARARELGGAAVVVTFIPHPLKVVASTKRLRLINTYAEKELLIGASGVDFLVVIPFDADFAALDAEAFVREILVGKIGMKHLVVGYDYAFGHGRHGNVALLRSMGERLGYTIDVLEPVGNGETVYSSTAVRTLIAAGDVFRVVSILGRHFSLAGRVIHGHSRGKGLGFPTANVCTDKELIPKDGVYAVKVKMGNVVLDGACNIGNNPTFGDCATAIEVFIFDYDGDLYGKELRLYFVARIRDEKSFPDKEALVKAIATDVATCREILAKTAVIEYREYLEMD
jgi:riboflavin kinase/FMN adenylyltransferase